MDTLSEWLFSIAWPLAKKVLVSLGLGYLTYTGLDTAVTSALDTAKAAVGSMPGDVALLVARFGFFDYMSITSGGIVSGLAWMYVKRLALTQGQPS